MKSSNPIFRDSLRTQYYSLSERPMTVLGTMNKLLLLTLIMITGAAAIFYQFYLKHYDFVNIVTTVSIIASFGLAILLAFKPDLTRYIAPIYAFLQGAFLSGISCFTEALYPGIVMQAITVTFVTVLAMAFLFRTGLIKATERFRSVIITASSAIFIFYLISFVLMLFHVNVPYFSANSGLALFINILIALVAALNLIIDFDFIENGARSNYPSYMEWYGAFGLLVTIVWLYIEILRILSRTRSK